MTLDRGVGTTTRQIKEAPEGAIYVCCRDDIRHIKDLARALGRSDLTFVGPSFFGDNRWRGNRKPLIVDHAAWDFFTDREFQSYYACHDYLTTFNILCR